MEDHCHRMTSWLSDQYRRNHSQERVDHDQSDGGVSTLLLAWRKGTLVAQDGMTEDGEVEETSGACSGRDEPGQSSTRSVNDPKEEDEGADSWGLVTRDAVQTHP